MKGRKLYFRYGLLAVLGALLLLLLTGCGEQKKKATEYITPVFSGLDGDGVISLSFDRERITADIGEKKEMTEREIETLDSLLSDIEKDYIVSQKNDLSNGDSVTVTGGLNKDLLKSYGIIFDNDTAAFTVEGLIEKTEININDYILESLYGFEGGGNLSLYVDYDSLTEAVAGQIDLIDTDISTETAYNKMWSCLNTITFTPQYFSYLSEGDTVTSELSMQNTEIPEYGIIFTYADYDTTIGKLTPLETVELGDYLTISTSGYNTFAYGYADLDMDRLTADMAERLSADQRSAYGNAYEGIDYQSEAETLANRIRSSWRYDFDTSLSKENELTNGDQITINSTLSDESIEEYLISDMGVILKGGSASQEIAGLRETAEIDLSDYITPVYHGFNGKGTVSADLETDAFQADLNALIVSQDSSLEGTDFNYRYASSLLNGASVATEEYTDLSEGDELTLQVEDQTGSIPDYGILIKASPIETTVSGLVPVVNVSLEDFVNPEFTGVDGAGYLSLALSEDLYDYIYEQFEENSRAAYDAATEGNDPEDEAYSALNEINSCWERYFDKEFSKSSKISNADVITVRALPSEDAKDAYGITVDGDTVYLNALGIYLTGFETEITAEDTTPLPAPQEIDLTEAITVTFSGICPQVSVACEIDDTVPYLSGTGLWDLRGTETIQAENGDLYELVIPHDDEQLLEMGYVVSKDTISTEIQGLDTWTLDVESSKQDKMPSLIVTDDQEELLDKEISNKASDMLNNLASEGGWIIWDEVETVTDEIWYANAQEGSSHHNMQGRLGTVIAFVRGFDREVTEKNMFYILWLSDTTLSPDGSLNNDNSVQAAFYYDRSEAEQALSGKFTDTLGEDVSIQKWTIDNDVPEMAEEAVEETEVEARESHMTTLTPVQPDASVLAKSTGSVITDGHAYYRFDDIDGSYLTWQQAKEFCENAGGHLATMTSITEYYAIRTLISDGSCYEYWLGATDNEFEGSWKWVTGEPLSWKNWDSGQPDNYTSNDEGMENYMSVYHSGNWNDLPSDEDDLGFILEMEPQEEQEGTLTRLTDLIPSLSSDQELWENAVDPYGNLYIRPVALRATTQGIVEYDLNSKYNEFSFTVSTTEDADSDAVFDLAVWGDDTLLYTLFNYSRTDAPQKVLLNVSGVRKLSIQSVTRRSSGWLLINDAVLLDTDETSEAEKDQGIYLAELPVVSYSNMDPVSVKGIPTDITGRIYKDAIIMDSGRSSEITFRVDTSNGIFHADLAMNSLPSAYADNVIVNFLIDGKPADSFRVSTDSGVTTADIELGSARFLTIRAAKENEDDGGLTILIGNIEVIEQDKWEAAYEELYKAPVFSQLPEEYEEKAAVITACGNYRYLRFDESMTFKEAQEFAEEAGLSLADPETYAQENALSALLNGGIWYAYWTAQNRDEDPGEDPEKSGVVLQQEATADKLPATAQYLGELESSAINSVDFGTLRIDNSVFANAVMFNTGIYCYAKWDLSGGYDALTFMLKTDPDNDVNISLDFAIFGDGKLLQHFDSVTPGTGPIPVMVDVREVTELTVMASSQNSEKLYMIEPVLYPAGTWSFDSEDSVEYVPASRLSSLTIVDETGTSHSDTLLTDHTGLKHDGAVQLNAGDNSFILYNLEGAFSEVSLRFAAASETATTGDRTVRILLDQEVVKELSLNDLFGISELITLDVTGTQTLRIETVSEEYHWDPVYLVDDLLK